MKDHCDDGPRTTCKEELCQDQDSEALESPTEVTQQLENVTDGSPELCPECDMGFEDLFDLLTHAKEVHEFNGTVKEEVFPSYSAFEVSFFSVLPTLIFGLICASAMEEKNGGGEENSLGAKEREGPGYGVLFATQMSQVRCLTFIFRVFCRA